MDVGSRGWDVRDAVIAAGVIAGVIFALVELSGSDIDRHAAQTGYTALALVLFTVFGSAGVALAHWQPRFALFGLVSATLSLLAAGATVVASWSENSYSLFGFGFSGTSGTVGGVTVLLAITSSAACVLLATVRPGEETGTRLVRIAAVGALAILDALVVLAILDDGVDIGPRVYAILATVYVFGAAILLVLRLLPAREEAPGLY
jgi:uncharacterized membrane protein